MTETHRLGPFVPCIGRFDTLANLQTAWGGGSQYPGTQAYCDDVGWVWSDGTNWKSSATGGTSGTQFFTSGASGTASAGVNLAILNGVNTTFALTFPAPQGEGDIFRVNAAAAISVAFSGVATSPATTIKTVPSTLAIGVGVAWTYHVADTTWYRIY